MEFDRLFLVITNQCNGNCRICSYWRHPAPSQLSVNFIKASVIPIIERHRIPLVLITGGEPALHPDLPELARDLKRTGATITLITNGSHLDTLYPRLEDSIDAFLLSLDTPNADLHRRTRGLVNFHQLIQYPAMIKKRDSLKQVAFSCVLQKRNIQLLDEYYKLVSALPIDAVFFNVPELKPHCFGRPGTINDMVKAETNLSNDEIAILEEKLRVITHLDKGTGLIQQSQTYFSECISYFKFLKGEEPRYGTPPCRVPSRSVVIDEKQRCLPCFYLPFSIPIAQAGERPLNHPELEEIRRKVLNDKEFRNRHCGFCLQFQG